MRVKCSRQHARFPFSMRGFDSRRPHYADVVELVDAPDLNSGGLKAVRVRVPPSVLFVPVQPMLAALCKSACDSFDSNPGLHAPVA